MILKDDLAATALTWRVGNYLLLFMSLLAIQIKADLEFPKDKYYTWKTGQWGKCVGEECGPGGFQTRTVWCVHAEGWTTHHSNCWPGDRPEAQRRCFKVCDWHRDLFEWEVSDWATCSLTPPPVGEQRLRPASCVTAQYGVQRRSVQCVRKSNRSAVADRVCESFSQKPTLEQACLIPCPFDCVVSEFSAWSDCSRTCGVGLQYRTRAVLAAPEYGGASCPNLTQTRTCNNTPPCPSGETEYQYSLKVGHWSQCRLPPQKEPWMGRTTADLGTDSSEGNSVQRNVRSAGHHLHQHHHHHPHPHHHNPKDWDIEIGYQIRQVRCVRNDGKNVMLSLCVQDASPITHQSCVMPRDCETSDWSPWSPCSKTCRAIDLSPGYRTRTRYVTRPPIGRGVECPFLEGKEACNIFGDSLPSCPMYVWRTTDWADCQVPPLLSPQDQRHGNLSFFCGGGIQTREIHCVQLSDSTAPHNRKEVSRPVIGRLCSGPLPTAVQHCSIPCPEECLLSPWSAWGPCLHDNCLEPQGRKGFRQRRRHVVREPAYTSRGCPHLVESIPCEDPVCFRWHVAFEEPCALSEGACGPGIKSQSFICVTAQDSAVPSERCLEDAPPLVLPCEVSCPGDCVVSSWSAWSTCSHSCSSKNADGRQSRYRTVLALPGDGGRPCPAAASLEEWRSCNEHPCMVFYWEASPWGPCMEDSSMTSFNATSSYNGQPTCAVGMQTRKVSCMKMTSGLVIAKRCPESSRPDSLRPCLLPCKKDCIVTPFSEWTQCPSTCLPVNESTATQSRYRIIIQRPANGGTECPNTLYEERECDSFPACPTYRWKTHRWQECTLVPDTVQHRTAGTEESCSQGLEVRGVTCMRDDGQAAEVADCLQWAGPMPWRFRPCRVPCRDDCSLSPWSDFTECLTCGGWRSRRRMLTGRSKKREKCQNSDLYPLVEKEPCPCVEMLSQPYGNWSSCILPESHGWRAPRDSRECGQGLRLRAVSCVDHEGRLVDPALCNSTGYLEEACQVPCPLDCKLSEWSAWSACSASCGSGLKVRSKWLREKPFNGGRPCPKLDLKNQAQVYEAVPCHNECGEYVWVPEPWSACTINAVDELPGCGEGVQSRKVRCMKRGGEGPSVIVDDSLCNPDDMPFMGQTCFLPCADECVMSQWGQWSSCPAPCDQSTVRRRLRQQLRLSLTRKSCPEDKQMESCILNSNCFTHHYNLSDWSTCLLSENAICGQGKRTRLLDCVRSDGEVVELSMCEELGLVKTWKLEVPCMVDCPVNCLLSEWSSWTQCSHTCGSQGQMVRSRTMLQQAHEEGRPCPSQLSQTKPCPIRPCYKWVLGKWSPCHVEGAECGEGVRERNLTCVVHWGDPLDLSSYRPVEEENCKDKERPASGQGLQLTCSVPCPGDCHLTEWSSWSLCQLTCAEGRSFESTGQRSRSRAVVIQVLENQDSCPQQIFETQPCKEGKCHSYEWKTSGWKDNERFVWCQRSDGVNVSGGCFLQNQPTSIRQCHPPCTKPFSHCTQSGVCGCERGYTEVMTTHGFLDYCTKTPGAENKKADVKTSSGRVKAGTSPKHGFLSEWTFQPIGPDGRIKLWVYGVTAGGFILVLFIIALSFLICKGPKQHKSVTPPQKPLTLAYDGDVDM
nr:thrombospondin type-1 domain-containing protein 7B-like isoform X1 [Paramormyrops kingsleyae]